MANFNAIYCTTTSRFREIPLWEVWLNTLKHAFYCFSLRWRHNGRDNVSNHQPHDCLLNRFFRLRSKKTSKLRVTGLCTGNSPGTGEFPAQMASYAENVSIWWRLHGHTIFQRNIERIKRATRLTGNPTVNLRCHRFSVRCSNMSCSFGPSARSIGSRCLVMPPILIDDMSTLVHVKMAI